MIQLQNIKKSYGNLDVLKGVSLDIAKGEVVSIVGKSGAGKSTLLHILGTLDSADTGSVIIKGQDISKLNSNALARFRNEHIGFVFQFHHLLPEFTAIENVCMPAFIKGVGEREAKKRAAQLLDYLGLAERVEHKPSQLSGGEQQRVAVARALMNHPAVILADEPSGNLDSNTSQDLHQLFFRLRRDFEQTFVIVTHNLELAQMSDRILRMQDGLIIDEERKVQLHSPLAANMLSQLDEEQKALAAKVFVPSDGEGYIPQLNDFIFVVDVQYVGDDAYVAIDVSKGDGTYIGCYTTRAEAGLEYIPQYFSFREGPPILKAIEGLNRKFGIAPHLLVVDGHGIAHPRKLGIASWLGVNLDIPTIGMAKQSLLPCEGVPAQKRSSTLPIIYEGELLGVALRTQDDVQPVYVSVGHKISLQQAVQILLQFSEEGYRIPQPLRRADQVARAYAKGEKAEFEFEIF